MFKNYIKMAWRNLLRGRAFSIINILGLSVAMTVVLLIAFWIFNEMTFDHYHKNHQRIAQVMKTLSFNGNLRTDGTVQAPMGKELRSQYGSYFEEVVMMSHGSSFLLEAGDKKISKTGVWAEPGAPGMFSFKAVKGKLTGLADPSSILLSYSTAKALFGDQDPINKAIKLDSKEVFTVTGVYEDIPANSDMRVEVLLPWSKYISIDEHTKNSLDNWGDRSWSCFVLLNQSFSMKEVSEKIKNIVPRNPGDKNADLISLYPMDQWRLYDEFKNGEPAGGRIRYVWMFGIIGGFILLLACINFMNLSTARSERRAKEVGIRKTVGSLKAQLIIQFLTESVLVVLIALLLSLLWIQWSLDFFNSLAHTQISVPWFNGWFWLGLLLFSLVTGMLAGSYPAFYLSRFKPVVVFKGIFKPGKYTLRPRQVLVVIQFAFSIAFIIGTIIVFKQIRYAKDRPVGYTTNGLITIDIAAPELSNHYAALQNDLLNSGVVANATRSTCPTTWVCSDRFGFDWEGKDPGSTPNFGTIGIAADFGKTINWQIKEGRDFSKDLKTDSASVILTESAAKMIGVKGIIGKIITDNGNRYRVIGVIRDMIISSPYRAGSSPVVFYLNPNGGNIMTIRVNPLVSMESALSKMEALFKRYHTMAPFRYEFNDELYARKFQDEQNIGSLAFFFASLAIFISCLGLFGLAAFMAERRTKEVGVRKVLGASVFSLWQMLSVDFLKLVIIAALIAIPAAWLLLSRWLENYEYRTSLSWWVFLAAVTGTILVTIITVSFHAIKAAAINPAKSLKSE